MKKMTCKQLGGACQKEFEANTFDEIAKLSMQHGMEMSQTQDKLHLDAMASMSGLMQNPEALKDWFEAKKSEFDSLPES